MDHKFSLEAGFVGNKSFVIAAVLRQEVKDTPCVMCVHGGVISVGQ